MALVLRDRVPEDAEVNWVRQVVEELYPESIKALVPSFKFSHEWYYQIRNQGIDKKKLRKRELWQLPMTVWTIDSEEDYTFVSSLKVMQGENDQTSKGLSLPIVSAISADMDLTRKLTQRHQPLHPQGGVVVSTAWWRTATIGGIRGNRGGRKF